MKSKVELVIQNRALIARVALLVEYGKQAREFEGMGRSADAND